MAILDRSCEGGMAMQQRNDRLIVYPLSHFNHDLNQRPSQDAVLIILRDQELELGPFNLSQVLTKRLIIYSPHLREALN